MSTPEATSVSQPAAGALPCPRPYESHLNSSVAAATSQLRMLRIKNTINATLALRKSNS